MPSDSTSGCDLLVWAESPSRVPLSTGRAEGHVGDIKDCPHKGWGNEEKPTGAYRIKIIHVPDKRKADLEHLLLPVYEFWPNDEEEDALGMSPQKRKYVPRRKRLDVVSFSQSDKDAIRLDDSRYHTMMSVDLLEVDDIDHAVLAQHYFQRDRSAEKEVMLSLIRLEWIPEPPNWEKNKGLFAHVDTTNVELALVEDRATSHFESDFGMGREIREVDDGGYG